MTSRILGTFLAVAAGAFAFAMGGTPAAAQQTGTETECVSSQTDWNVCLWNEPKECWGVSKPKETVNTRDGQPVSVRRGDILMFVTFRPGAGAAGEVSFTGGYPFAPGSTVGVDIGGKKFDLVTDGEWAWPKDASADAELLAAMKAGSQAIVSARSGRGTETRDTFSLNGFTAAMTEAENRCK
jgi:hypothetical protein